MSIITKLRGKLYKTRADNVFAEVQINKELAKLRYARNLIPASTLETDEMIVINNDIFVRCYVLGVSRGLSPGFPVELNDTFLDKISMLSIDGVVIDFIMEMVPQPSHESLKLVDEAIHALNRTLHDTKERDPTMNITSAQEDRKSAIIMGKMLHRGDKQLSCTAIITITTKDRELLNQTEIRLSQILKEHTIEYDIPRYDMMAAFRASLLLPVRKEAYANDLLVDYASKLALMSNPNAVTSDTGVLIGTNRITGANVLANPDMFYHASVVAPTGGGKTVFVMTYLLRAFTVLGKNAVYITTKDERGADGKAQTDIENVIAELGEDIAEMITIGKYGKHNINPLQIIYRGVPDEHTYSSHLTLILRIFDILFQKGAGEGATRNMDSEIVLSVKELWASRGITRDPATWKDAVWPNLKDLHLLWRDMLKQQPGNVTLQALISKTALVDETWKFLLRPTNVNLSKPFLIFDLSSCPGDCAQAVHGFVTGLLMQFFSVKEEGSNGTVIACDEAGALMKSESFCNFIEEILARGRSGSLSGLLITQGAADWARNETISSMIKTNCGAHFILGKGVTDVNLPEIQRFYSLSDREMNWLQGNIPGDMIAKIGNTTVPVHNDLSGWEYDALLNSHARKKTDSKTESSDVFELVHPALKPLIETHGIIISSWTKIPIISLQKLGYTAENIQHCISGGRHKIWVRDSVINSNETTWGNQSIEHKGSVVELAGYLLMNGFTVSINDHEGADISAEYSGRKTAFEFELSKKSIQDLQEKKISALKTHDEVYFITTSSLKNHIADAVGGDIVYPRGDDVMDLIETLLKDRKVELQVV